MPASGLTLLTSLAAILTAVGLYLLKRGLRPPRIGNDPYCRRCNYALTGLASRRCPECGTAITVATPVYGQRHTRPWKATIGALLLLVGLSGVALTRLPAFRAIDWYHYRPTFWVIRDLASGSDRAGVRAWDELDRRRTLKQFTPDVEQQVIEAMLDAQGKAQTTSAVRQTVTAELARRAQAGTLSPAQFKRLFQQAIRPTLEHRPTYVTGERAAFAARSKEKIWELRRWQSTATVVSASFAGRPAWCGSSSGPVPFVDAMSAVDAPGPGRYPLELTFRVDIFPEKANEDRTQPSASWESTLTGFANVEPTPSEDNPRLIRKAELLGAMRKSVTGSIGWPFGQKGPDVHVSIDSPPENVAFEVFLKARGQERAFTSVHQYKGRNGSYGFQAHELAEHQGSKVDLILRSSGRVARQTSDMFETWAGEIVIRDLHVPPPPVGPPPR